MSRMASAKYSKFMSPPVTPHEKLEANKDDIRVRMELLILDIQARVCRSLEDLCGDKMRIDTWVRPNDGGGGITCIIENNDVIERGGCNVSVVQGVLPVKAMEQMRARGKNLGTGPRPFFACGVSSVIHPANPHIPTMHFNYRYFDVQDDDGVRQWWFGGGTDLTPYVLHEDDVVHFHQTLKDACDKYDESKYPAYKKWCDTYFHIPHRGESRGVGGIFFDDLEEPSQEEVFQFVTSCAEATPLAYLPIVEKHMKSEFSSAEREWQLLRRGRYVEFNLVYDRGTKFGLNTPGSRIESILMSMPQTCRWEYMHEPEEESPEGKLLQILRNPREWI